MYLACELDDDDYDDGTTRDDGRNVLDFYTSRGDFFEENETKGRLIFCCLA